MLLASRFTVQLTYWLPVVRSGTTPNPTNPTEPNPPPPAAGTGNLQVSVEGLPEAAEAAVTVIGPEDYNGVVTRKPDPTEPKDRQLLSRGQRRELIKDSVTAVSLRQPDRLS